LASPIAWGHYFVLLTLPFLLLWRELPAGSLRTAFLALVVVFCQPPRTFANWAMGVADAGQLQYHLPPPDDVGLSLTVFGAFTYALAALFVLLAAARLEAAQPAGDGINVNPSRRGPPCRRQGLSPLRCRRRRAPLPLRRRH